MAKGEVLQEGIDESVVTKKPRKNNGKSHEEPGKFKLRNNGIPQRIPAEPMANVPEVSNGQKKSILRKKGEEITLMERKEKEGAVISFEQYFEKLEENPDIAQLSHSRVYNMIMDKGAETREDGTREFGFFKEELFGLDRPLEKIVKYFESAADRTEIRKRILLLVGPVGGGKSTIAAMLKRGMEKYSRTQKGAAYAIKGCPMHEEPLHLVSEREVQSDEDPNKKESYRKVVEGLYGVHIEGDLCPVCKYELDQKKKEGKDIWDFEVEKLYFSEKDRRGIGTFLPSDPKSQDISTLTGSIDFSTVGEYGSESHPKAYKFDGELNKASRGIMEYIEMLKADEKFHYVLLELTQGQNIKIDRFPLTYADEVIMSHTNENEYKAFLANKKAEALHDRVYPIYVPYNLRTSDETKIYEKMLSSKESNLKIGKDKEKGEVHLAPHTLEVAANLAVLSRLVEGSDNPNVKKIDLVKKMKLYNGEELEEFSKKDLEDIQKVSWEEGKEGMNGVSPRYVINRLSIAVSSSRKEKGKEKGACITPITAIRELKDGLVESASLTDEEKKNIVGKLIPEVRRDYDQKAKKEVQKAFIGGHEDHAKAIVQDYVDNVDAFCNKRKIKDFITGEEHDPDEKTMRRIEEQIGVSEPGKQGFRENLMIRIASLSLEGKKFDYKSHPKLREAVEKKLLEDYKDVIKTTLTARSKNPEQTGRLEKVTNHLVEKQGYCNHCAAELIDYVADLYGRE